jgi:hypothetical protein
VLNPLPAAAEQAAAPVRRPVLVAPAVQDLLVQPVLRLFMQEGREPVEPVELAWGKLCVWLPART